MTLNNNNSKTRKKAGVTPDLCSLKAVWCFFLKLLCHDDDRKYVIFASYRLVVLTISTDTNTDTYCNYCIGVSSFYTSDQSTWQKS